MLDNTALGHRHIVDAFGVDALPTLAWQMCVCPVGWGRRAAGNGAAPESALVLDDAAPESALVLDDAAP